MTKLIIASRNFGDAPKIEHGQYISTIPAFLKLWSADHKWSSGSALVVLLD